MGAEPQSEDETEVRRISYTNKQINLVANTIIGAISSVIVAYITVAYSGASAVEPDLAKFNDDHRQYGYDIRTIQRQVKRLEDWKAQSEEWKDLVDLSIQAIQSNDDECHQRLSSLERLREAHYDQFQRRAEEHSRRLDRIETRAEVVNDNQDKMIQDCMQRTAR